jgi:lipid-binding SYLF domain-containing protein
MYMPGEVNGIMTQQTRDAIRRFQFLNNLPVTGNLDEQTKMALDEQWCGSCVSSQLTPPYSPSAGLQKPSRTMGTQTQRQTGSAVQNPGTSAQKSDRSYDTTADTTRKAAKANKVGKVDRDITDRVAKSTEVLRDLTGGADKRIPNALLEHAEAIAVIPHVIKGAFGVGGRYGKGLVSERLNNGRWSAPAFMSIGGGSFGAQIGVSATDLVLVFTDKNALNLLEGGKDLKLGADASVAAGPIGRSAEAGVNLNLETGIYAYSRSKGLFAGIALDGAVLSTDKDTNEEVYGTSNAKDILSGAVAVNNTVRPFVNALNSVIPPKRISQK